MSIYTTEDIQNFLRTIDWELSDRQNSQLREYFKLIQHWNKRINLISRADIQNLANLHFFPSVWFASQFREYKNGTVLDLGTGGGFPGIIMNILLPENQFILLDSVRKKTLFLKEVKEELKLTTNIVCARVEEYAVQNNEFCDIIVSRSVAEINQLWQWAKPLLKEKGIMATLKRQDYVEELENLNEKEGLNIRVTEPANNWKKISPAISNKYIIKMEKR